MTKAEKFLRYARAILIEKKYSLYQAEKYFGRDYFKFYEVYTELLNAATPVMSKVVITLSELERLNNFVLHLTNELKEMEKYVYRETKEYEKIGNYEKTSNKLIDENFYIDNGDGTYTRDDDKWLQYLSKPVQVNLEDVKLYETALERAPGRQEQLESLVAEEIYALTFILGG